ncbi:MAG: PhzF family phenazine biosynthesis protein [Actinomycetes bacterium]
MSPEERLEFHVVDVFASTTFSGNPLAVVLGAEALTTRQMQRLATEFNLSETAFPLFGEPEVADAGADYRLRIFTPETEVPFAGHPSIGTAWLLRELGQVEPREGGFVQLCGAGALPVRFGGGALTLTGGRPQWSEPVDPSRVVAAAGLGVDDVVGPVLVCGTGLPFIIVRVQPDRLTSCEADLAVLRSERVLGLGTDGVYVVAWDDLREPVRARMFAGDVIEDPATGSAALGLGVYLCVTGVLPDGGSFSVVQGVEMGRPAHLSVTVEALGRVPSELTVTGSAVAVASGRIAVPKA